MPPIRWPPPTWSSEFDAWVQESLARGDVDALADFAHRGPGMPYAHPTVEHFVPLFVALGAAAAPDQAGVFRHDLVLSALRHLQRQRAAPQRLVERQRFVSRRVQRIHRHLAEMDPGVVPSAPMIFCEKSIFIVLFLNTKRSKLVFHFTNLLLDLLLLVGEVLVDVAVALDI